MKFPVYQDKPIQKVILIQDKEQTLLWGSVAEKPIWSKDQRQKKLESVRHDDFKATDGEHLGFPKRMVIQMAVREKTRKVTVKCR